MNNLKRFKSVLNVRYTHLREETASYAYKFKWLYGKKGLYIYFEKSNGLTDWKNNFNFLAGLA